MNHSSFLPLAHTTPIKGYDFNPEWQGQRSQRFPRPKKTQPHRDLIKSSKHKTMQISIFQTKLQSEAALISPSNKASKKHFARLYTKSQRSSIGICDKAESGQCSLSQPNLTLGQRDFIITAFSIIHRRGSLRASERFM